jgi:YVTN family beta-propeller protein
VGLALFALAGVVMIVHADELSPPYVIALRPWTSALEQVKPFAVAVDEERGYAYIAATNKGVAILTGTALLDTKEDIGSTVAVAVDPSSGYAYVAGKGPEGNIFFLRGTTRLTEQLSLGSNVEEIVPFTETGYVYVALPEANSVSILSGTAHITDVEVGIRPVAIAPFDGRVYVANKGDDTVSVIDGHTEVDVVSVGQTPTYVGANPVNGYIYVSNSGDNSVSVIDSHSLAVIETIPDIQEPGQIAINATTGRVYVLSADTTVKPRVGWVKVLEGTTLAKTVALALDPRDIAVNPRTNYVYVNVGAGEDSRVTVMSDTLVVETFQIDQSAFDIAINKRKDLAYVPIHGGYVAIFGRTRVYGTDPLDADSSYTLPCTNTVDNVDLPIVIDIPQGAIKAAETRVLCIPLNNVDAGAEYLWARQGFRLVVSVAGVNQPDYVFNTPLEVEIAYLPDDKLPSQVIEGEIMLRSRTQMGGIWTWSEDGINATTQLSQTNQFLGTLTSPEEYALVWPIPRVYLPLITRE